MKLCSKKNHSLILALDWFLDHFFEWLLYELRYNLVICCSEFYPWYLVWEHSLSLLLKSPILCPVLWPFLQVDLAQPVPECLHSRFIGANDDGGDGDNWSCKTYKAPVKSWPSTNQYPTFLQARCPSCRPKNSVKAPKSPIVFAVCVGFATTGTYGAAVTFVSGKKERETLVRFAEICNMCIRALPGEWLLVLNWQHSVLLWSLRLLTCWYIVITIIINWRAPWKNRIRSTSVKQKITRKASDAAEYIELFRSFTRDRHARRI